MGTEATRQAGGGPRVISGIRRHGFNSVAILPSRASGFALGSWGLGFRAPSNPSQILGRVLYIYIYI